MPTLQYHAGYCAATMDGDAGDCALGEQGSIKHDATSWAEAEVRCWHICAGCARCQYISVSVKWHECSWFAACDLSNLRTDVNGFRSAAVPRSKRYGKRHIAQFAARASIAFALTGSEPSAHLDEWQRTWLVGERFVYVPDKPAGSWAHLYQPPSVNQFHTRSTTDANFLWSLLAADRTFPKVDWIFVVDIDAYVFPEALRAHVADLDPARPILAGMPVYVTGQHESFKSYATPCAGSHMASAHRRTTRGRCVCPTVRRDNSWEVDFLNGSSAYKRPKQYVYGGTGVLISRGLLQLAPQDTWEQCARRLLCGAADMRLSVCALNILADGATAAGDITPLWANGRFLYSRATALSVQHRNQNLFSLSKTDEQRGAVLEALDGVQFAHQCPVSLHRVEPSLGRNLSRTRCGSSFVTHDR